MEDNNLIYYVGISHIGEVKIPRICTCCMKETHLNELITDSSLGEGKMIGFNKSLHNFRKIKLKFGVCEECYNKRKKRSVNIVDFNADYDGLGLYFTNKDYAELFANLNGSESVEMEDTKFTQMSFLRRSCVGVFVDWWLPRRIIPLILLLVVIISAIIRG